VGGKRWASGQLWDCSAVTREFESRWQKIKATSSDGICKCYDCCRLLVHEPPSPYQRRRSEIGLILALGRYEIEALKDSLNP